MDDCTHNYKNHITLLELKYNESIALNELKKFYASHGERKNTEGESALIVTGDAL
jgi:hypothetical protein